MPGQPVGDLDQPPGQRRQLVVAELPFAPVHQRLDQVERQVGVEQGRQHRPDQRMQRQKGGQSAAPGALSHPGGKAIGARLRFQRRKFLRIKADRVLTIAGFALLRGPAGSWTLVRTARIASAGSRLPRGGLRTACAVSAPSSSLSAWCVIAASLGAVLFLALQARRAAHRPSSRLGALMAMALYNPISQPAARPRRPRRPDRRPVARHRRSRPPGGGTGAPAERGRDQRRATPCRARAAPSIRSPPRSANSARWCASSPTPSRRTTRRCARSRAGAAAPMASVAAVAPADAPLALSESDAVSAPDPLRALDRDAAVDLITEAIDGASRRSLSAADRHAAAAQGALSTRRCRGCARPTARSCRPANSSTRPRPPA